MAQYEAWKSSRGTISISVKLRDNAITIFNNMSHVVGKCFVEYRLLQGKGKTIRCLIKKASLSNGEWTLSLEPFNSFAPAYDWYDVSYYQRFKTVHYDQFMIAKWNKKGNFTTRVPEFEKHTLSYSGIIAYQLLGDHTLRLYISGVDVAFSVVKLWVSGGNGAYNTSKFLGEAVNTHGTWALPWTADCARSVSDIEDGNHVYKIYDYYVTDSGEYTFTCQFYNMFLEQGSASIETIINVELPVRYLKNEMGEILATESDSRLTV